MVIVKDQKTEEWNLIDEGFIVVEKPTAIVITENNDNTKTITTSKIDYTQQQVKTVVETLKKNNINTVSTKIESLQYTEGPTSTEYVVVLSDKSNNPTKQVTIVEDKQTKQTTVIDYTTLQNQVKYIKPVQDVVTVLPVADYYKPEIKDLVAKVESKVENIKITKVNKI